MTTFEMESYLTTPEWPAAGYQVDMSDQSEPEATQLNNLIDVASESH